jgi:hypothetical protein
VLDFFVDRPIIQALGPNASRIGCRRAPSGGAAFFMHPSGGFMVSKREHTPGNH